MNIYFKITYGIPNVIFVNMNFHIMIILSFHLINIFDFFKQKRYFKNGN